MKATSVLLEPTFDFRIELPQEYLGRAMTDITNMHGKTDSPEIYDGYAILEGNCPVATMRGYASELRAYTRGAGKITMNVGAYVPAHNSDEVIGKYGYNPDLDERNPSSSIFCKAGAGYAVPWYEADVKMHIRQDDPDEVTPTDTPEVPERARAVKYHGTVEEDKELMRIFEATYGKITPRRVAEKVENRAPEKKARQTKKPLKRLDEYVILDGYNVIFAWDELKDLANGELGYAREALTRIMCNYTAFRKCHSIIVFDAYKQKDSLGSEEICGNTKVVYTKTGETADAYIEKLTYEIASDNLVRVVTSDLTEQYIILGNGALRVSAREFKAEVENTTAEINDIISSKSK